MGQDIKGRIQASCTPIPFNSLETHLRDFVGRSVKMQDPYYEHQATLGKVHAETDGIRITLTNVQSRKRFSGAAYTPHLRTQWELLLTPTMRFAEYGGGRELYLALAPTVNNITLTK